jgi:hypothetical protein
MHSLRLRFAMVLVLAPLGITPAMAQDTNNEAAVVPNIARGARVSFTLPDAQSPEAWQSRRLLMKGTVTEVRGDSLVVLLGGAPPLTLSRFAMGDLSVSQGLQRGWQAKPASTALGAALFVGNVFLFSRVTNGPSSASARGTSTAPLAGLLGLNAVVLFKQAFGKKERWERVSDAQVAVRRSSTLQVSPTNQR